MVGKWKVWVPNRYYRTYLSPSTKTKLHVNYSVAGSWHSENIARHAPYHEQYLHHPPAMPLRSHPPIIYALHPPPYQPTQYPQRPCARCPRPRSSCDAPPRRNWLNRSILSLKIQKRWCCLKYSLSEDKAWQYCSSYLETTQSFRFYRSNTVLFDISVLSLNEYSTRL